MLEIYIKKLHNVAKYDEKRKSKAKTIYSIVSRSYFVNQAAITFI